MNQKPTYAELKRRLSEFETVLKEKKDLELIYNSITNSVITLDPDQRILSVNSAAQKMIGRSEADVLNKKCYDVLHNERDCTSPEGCPFKKLFSGEKVHTMEAMTELKTGTFIISCTPVLDEKGKLLKVFHVGTNITPLKRNEKKASMLLEATRTIPLSKNFDEAARKIYDICKGSIGARCGYVAMKSENKKDNELLFLDDGGLPCYVDPSLPMPIRGLRKQAYDTREVAYSNDFMGSQYNKLMPEGHMDLHNVLFSPLRFGDDVAGVIGLANKPGGFDENDIEVAKAFGEVAALALHHSTMRDNLIQTERFRSRLLAQSPNPILVINAQKEVVYANKAFETLTGYRSEEIMQIKPPYPWWTQDTITKTGADLDHSMKEGAVGVEEKFQKKSGEIFYVEITSSPVLKNGTLDYYLANWVDVTDKKKAEFELKETIKVLEAAFLYAPAMITITSAADGTYLEVNDAFAKITGHERKEVIGKTSIDIGLLAPQDRNRHIKNLIKDGHISNLELDITRADGTCITCLYSGVIIGDEDAKRLLSIAVDITDRKRKDALLKQKQIDLEAHSKKLQDMNTALNVLIDHRTKEKEDFKKDILNHFDKLVFPYFPKSNRVEKEDLSTNLSIIERNIKEILLKGENRNISLYLGLTPMELQIAQMIKEGETSKDIAKTFNMSVHTVYFHRENIRKKLNLTKSRTNLKTFLQSKFQ